ncbi:MAG: methyltransferase domain-containing protein [Betaproteobacteria bacterium]|nr:methyltransferase domain-containing protein [Betaproteobacteria bacterium]
MTAARPTTTAAKLVRHIAFTLLVGVTIGAFAQAQPAKPGAYEPQVGQEGKDVVWVPTPQALVDRMLDMAKVTPNDYLMDLGSGDGRTVITAAKRGVHATGIEYNPEMVELSKRNAEKEGVAGKVEFRKADLFETDFSGASVITMFLLPDINLRLRPTILDMKPGTRVVSNTFTMGEWEADETSTVSEASGYYRTALLWIVPAKVEGQWKSAQGDLELTQTFQKIGGNVRTSNGPVMLNGRLHGDRISFTAGGAEFTGRVDGNTIEGTVKSGGSTSAWKATRG